MTALLAQRTHVDRAFERLYRRHAADVYRYALGVLRNPADAEDVTQATFLNAFRALERGEEPRVPHNWLIAIAHNVCRQRFRAAARRPREVELHDVAERLVTDDDVPTPEDLKRALGHLGFNQRAALVMREIEGRSYADIAEVLGLSLDAVETLIFRARRALREQLDGSLTCLDAERAISRQLDGRLSRAEKGQLRAHLRECGDCATLARRQRAQRSALRSLGATPLPPSLAALFGGGGASVAAKVAAVVLAAGAAGGAGYDLHHALTAPPRAAAGVPANRLASRAPARSAPARVSLPALVLDRPKHASLPVVPAARGRALGRSRHAVPRGRALGRSAGSAASAVGRSRRRARGAVASARRGAPPWAHAAASPRSGGNGVRATPARPAQSSGGNGGGQSRSRPPQTSRGNGVSQSHSRPPQAGNGNGSNASFSGRQRLHP